jgi:hypothetical protein
LTRRLVSLVALGAAAVALVLTLPAPAATPKLIGSVGPDFTITLTVGGKRVKTLRPGTYRISIMDRSSSHNFHLRGPGVSRALTGVSFRGTRHATVRLKRGRYTYVCQPHLSSMRGTFTVR